MKRATFTEKGLWRLLGVVVGDEEGDISYIVPDAEIAAMERAGLLWLHRTSGGYLYRMSPTDEGARLVRRWAKRCAKEAAYQFSKVS